MDLLIKLLVTGGIMGMLDVAWLGYIAKKIYYNEMGSILLEKFNLVPALLFYIVYIIGVIIFVINPALSKDSLSYAIGYGALFGFVAYVTYDLTSLAVIKGFSSKIVVIDLLWGTLLTAVVSGASFYLIRLWTS